jgi:hypothetical protein
MTDKSHQLGDAPIEAQYIKQMKATAAFINEMFNGQLEGDDRTTGFVLMVFPFGDKSGRCNYISNGANRDDIVVLMKEMIARFEGQPELKGHG